MSKNFELLRQVGKAQDWFGTSPGLQLPPEEQLSQTPGASGRGSQELPSNASQRLLRWLEDLRPGRHRLNLDAIERQEVIKLVQRVFLMPGASTRRMVLFFGLENSDGCSRICATASEALAARVEASVCVVDANLQSPFLHRYFSIENQRGLTEALRQSDPLKDFARQLPGSNLWVVPCGSSASGLQPLPTSGRLRARITELRGEFEYVLINAAPANLYAELISLGRLMDGVVLVVEANCTRRDKARKVKESLEAENVPLLGAVLDKRVFPIPELLYSKL